MKPRAPTPQTAATRSTVVAPPAMGAWMIGWLNPNRCVRTVWSGMPHLLRFKAETGGRPVLPVAQTGSAPHKDGTGEEGGGGKGGARGKKGAARGRGAARERSDRCRRLSGACRVSAASHTPR